MPSPLAVLGRALRGRRSDEARSLVHAAGLATSGTLELTSPDFTDGGAMPIETTEYGANQSPALAWSGLPETTAQLVLIMEDIDVPLRTPIVHTVALFDPTLGGVERGRLAETCQRFLTAAFGRSGYAGPRPIAGHGAHRYRFHLYALGVDVPASVLSVRDLPDAVAGHVLARGTITGTFERA